MTHYSYFEKLIIAILVFSVILILIDVFIMVSVYIDKVSAKKIEQKKQSIREKIQEYISAWLIEDDVPIVDFMTRETHNYFSDKQMKDPLFREILYEEIFIANRVLLGDEQMKIKELYKYFGFEQKIKKEFFKYKWYKIVNAANDMLAIKALESSTRFTELLDHPNQFVRLIAVKAEISMGGDQVEILSELRYPLTDWELYEIINFLKRNNFKQFNSLEKLIDHKEPSVCVLGLLIARTFQELYLNVDFMKLLLSSNTRVRKYAIEYLAECGDGSYVQILKKIFPNQAEAVQKAILKYVELHGTDDDVPFIYNRLNDYRPAIQLKAAETLYNMNTNSSGFLNYLEHSKDPKNQKLAIHVLRNQ